MPEQFHIVARPMQWRFPPGNIPPAQYRTRSGWTLDSAKALQLGNRRTAQIESCCVPVPVGYSARIEPTPESTS